MLSDDGLDIEVEAAGLAVDSAAFSCVPVGVEADVAVAALARAAATRSA